MGGGGGQGRAANSQQAHDVVTTSMRRNDVARRRVPTRFLINQCQIITFFILPGRVAQSVGHLTRKSGVLGSIPGLATYFRFSFRYSRRAVVNYWRKYVHEVLVNRFGGLSLPWKSVVRLTDRPDMTLDVYRGRKTPMQQMQHFSS